MHEKGTSVLYFKIPDLKQYKKDGSKHFTLLECVNLSAADCRVSTKYGNWDSMSGRLLVECNDPLITWSRVSPCNDDISEVTPTNDAYYLRTPQESCMVKATFDIKYVVGIRDTLHSVKAVQLKERKEVMAKHKEGVDKHLPVPTTVREGLPNWVNYIPAKWYSATVRKVLEYIIIIYTILTLLWAIWQLYKHVSFIQNMLKPIVDCVKFYFLLLKIWFEWFDEFLDVWTTYWWTFLKPFFVLASPIYTFLSQLFKPLRDISGVVTLVLEPIVRVLNKIMSLLHPVLQPLRQGLVIFKKYFQKLFDITLYLWRSIMGTALMQVVVERVGQTGAIQVLNEVIHGSIDPLKMQVLIIRNILTRSCKNVYLGLRFILVRIQMTFLFFQQERAYANEENQEHNQSVRESSDKPKTD